jgi:hypothetical protein
MREEDLKEKISLSICTDDTFRKLYSRVLKISLNPSYQEVENAYNSLINDSRLGIIYLSSDMKFIINHARKFFNDFDAYCQENIQRRIIYCLQHLAFHAQSEQISDKQIINFWQNKSLLYLYATREEIETHIKNRTYYEFHLCNNTIQITPAKKSNVCAVVTNKIAAYSLADELLKFFQETITGLIQGKINTFDDIEIPTLSNPLDNVPLVKGAKYASEGEITTKSKSSKEKTNIDGNTSSSDDKEYSICISPHGLKFMLSTIYYDKIILPGNEKALSIFMSYVESIEIFPALVNFLVIVILSLFYPKLTLSQYTYTLLGAEFFSRFFRKAHFFYKLNIFMIVSILFERIASFYIDSIIIIILTYLRFEDWYYPIIYVLISLICHFIFLDTYKKRLHIHNSLASYSINHYGEWFIKEPRIRF